MVVAHGGSSAWLRQFRSRVWAPVWIVWLRLRFGFRNTVSVQIRFNWFRSGSVGSESDRLVQIRFSRVQSVIPHFCSFRLLDSRQTVTVGLNLVKAGQPRPRCSLVTGSGHRPPYHSPSFESLHKLNEHKEESHHNIISQNLSPSLVQTPTTGVFPAVLSGIGSGRPRTGPSRSPPATHNLFHSPS
uniref:Uncharacterized protein n=1 Tax=Helianthus annuus TaxID=4232 RepID=A0A251V5Q9_HELAN